jgi:hypothetical protein
MTTPIGWSSWAIRSRSGGEITESATSAGEVGT